MQSAMTHADLFLRGDGLFSVRQSASRPAWWLPLMVVTFSPIYGAFMGSYELASPERLLTVLFSAVKVPLLLFATTALCLPGFFVLNTVLGLRDDFREALQAIHAGQAGLSITLASLAPLTRFWYFSCGSYRAALLFNAAMFTVATLAGQLIMLRYYRPLIRRHRHHRLMLMTWVGLYAFVGMQMGWMLRPFIGDPRLPVAFFRQEPFSNAYVVIARLFLGTHGG
jgi:hypothetical protein